MTTAFQAQAACYHPDFSAEFHNGVTLGELQSHFVGRFLSVGATRYPCWLVHNKQSPASLVKVPLFCVSATLAASML